MTLSRTVVVKDFVMVGCGETMEEVTNDHDRTQTAFLQQCNWQGLKLNINKLNLQKIRSRLHQSHAWPPEKVSKLILPSEKAAVQWLYIGLAQYLIEQVFSPLINHT